MAVPGRATDRMSAGTNHLIRNRKAQLVLTADDIVRELMWDLGAEPATLRPKPATPQLTPDETGLLGCFRTDDPLSHETLCRTERTRIPASWRRCSWGWNWQAPYASCPATDT